METKSPDGVVVILTRQIVVAEDIAEAVRARAPGLPVRHLADATDLGGVTEAIALLVADLDDVTLNPVLEVLCRDPECLLLFLCGDRSSVPALTRSERLEKPFSGFLLDAALARLFAVE